MGQHFGATPFLIAGPCVVEADDLNLRIGEALAELGTKLGIHVIYKASYDKANRSRLKGARGPGLERGLEALAADRWETGLPSLTGVHEGGQVRAAAQGADVLQSPAFLCRQTDLLIAAGRAGRAVNVKKGQWLSPDAMQGAVEKLRAGGAPELAVTERGTFFGYGDLVVDMRNFARLRAVCGVPVVYDATHSVQQPGRAEEGARGARRSDATELRARELKVDELVQDNKKLPAFTALLERRGVAWEESAFVGDDLPDLPLLTRVGLPIAVANAVPEAKAAARVVTTLAGGQGAVREVAELILRARGQWQDLVTQYFVERGDVAYRADRSR